MFNQALVMAVIATLVGVGSIVLAIAVMRPVRSGMSTGEKVARMSGGVVLVVLSVPALFFALVAASCWAFPSQH